jgi:hypothetical protein
VSPSTDPSIKFSILVADPDTNSQWQPEVIEHQKLTEEERGVGTRLRHVSTFMSKRISVVRRSWSPNPIVGSPSRLSREPWMFLG